MNLSTLWPYMRHRGGNEGVNWSIFLTTMAGIGLVIYYFYHLAFRVTAGGMGSEDYSTLVNLTPESIPQVVGPDIGDLYGEVTQTPEPTMTATPEHLQTIEPLPEELMYSYKNPSDLCWDCDVYVIKIRFTHYTPWVGSINCWDFRDGYCQSAMASELRWEQFLGVAAACPPEWPFGTWVEAPGHGAWVCLDRGSEVICNKEYCQVDILAASIGDLDGQIIESLVYIMWK